MAHRRHVSGSPTTSSRLSNAPTGPVSLAQPAVAMPLSGSFSVLAGRACQFALPRLVARPQQQAGLNGSSRYCRHAQIAPLLKRNRCSQRVHAATGGSRSSSEPDDGPAPLASSSGRAGDEADAADGGTEDIAVRQPQRGPRNPVTALLARVIAHLQRTHSGPHGLRRLVAGVSMLVVGVLMLGAGILGAAAPGRRLPRFQPPREMVYSEFLGMVNAGSVRAVRFDESSHRIYFDTYRASQLAAEVGQDAAAGAAAGAAANLAADASAAGAASSTQRSVPREYYTKRIADPHLITSLSKAGVEFGAMSTTLTSFLARTFGTLLALWLPLVPLYFVMKHLLEGRMGGKKKRGSGTVAQRPPVTFADVAGVDSAKEELMEVVACLRDVQRYARLNATMPSGVLLCGPPGTGKTLLAKAVAGEAGVPFFSASASEFVEMFVGRGASRVRDLFREARRAAPSVVFIDELDAIGGRRGISMNEERDQTLNQLLTELDGFEERPGVLLLAATNRAEMLDPALTRPGRLSRKVVVPLPNEQGRCDILSVHLRRIPMESPAVKGAVAQEIARITGGFSGAELANVVNEGALLAGRTGAAQVTPRDLVEGVQRTRYGVNGGTGGAMLPKLGLQQRVMDWVADAVTRNTAAAAAAQPRAPTV